jgi:predicted GNAT family acetyltransferase
MPIHIQHDKLAKKFFAVVDGKNCVLSYRILPDGKTLDYYSTFVPSELRGKHIGEDIIRYALQYAISYAYSIIPSCPFVKRVIDRYPEYKILVKN